MMDYLSEAKVRLSLTKVLSNMMWVFTKFSWS